MRGAEYVSLSGSWVAVPLCAFVSGAFALAREDLPQKILNAHRMRITGVSHSINCRYDPVSRITAGPGTE